MGNYSYMWYALLLMRCYSVDRMRTGNYHIHTHARYAQVYTGIKCACHPCLWIWCDILHPDRARAYET